MSLYSVVFYDNSLNCHYFVETNGLNSWISGSIRTFCLFAEEMVIFFELELIVTLYVTLFSSF